VPDQASQLDRDRAIVLVQEGEKLTEADFVAIDLIGVEPDPSLRLLRVRSDGE
jgi:hypothetical protein